jgi:methyl-accepting chemotaxis protein
LVRRPINVSEWESAMHFFTQLSLGRRLALGFGVVLVLLVGVAIQSLMALNGLNQTLQEVAVKGGARSAAVIDLERSAQGFMASMRDLRGAELSQGEVLMKRVRERWAAYVDAEKAVQAALPSGEAQVAAMLNEARQRSLASLDFINEGEKEAGGRGDTAVFFAISNRITQDSAALNDRFKAWSDALVSITAWEREVESRAAEQATSAVDRQMGLVIGASLMALLFGVFTAWRIISDVTKGFSSAVRATERLAQHDLSVPVNTAFSGELGVLARSLESMRLAQLELACGVRDACDDIATASAEIAQGSHDLSGRAEQTAANMHGAIGALDSLNSSVDMSAQSAQSANALATEAQSAATRGDHVVGQAVATMGEIDTASRKIADITAIIDGIAFQTNILALNAAVEAARAGEQGRGFAVVASEVRSLAQRSATAAREIKQLIEATLQKVASGSEHVKRAGGATMEIMASVQRVSATIASISDETSNQRQGIGQANASVKELDQGAQQNAALAEESAAAASSLHAQAARLKTLVDRFKIA